VIGVFIMAIVVLRTTSFDEEVSAKVVDGKETTEMMAVAAP